MTYLAINGKLCAESTAKIPVDDRGFLYGESVFTTLRCYDGVPFRLPTHLARLQGTLDSPVFALPYKLDAQALTATVAELLRKNSCPTGLVRIMITRGRGGGPNTPPTSEPLVLITAREIPPLPVLENRTKNLAVSSIRRDKSGWLGRHKLGSYLENLLARREARAVDCDEGILCDLAGNYLECACANLFAVVKGELFTAGEDENILPGIARKTVLECAAQANTPVTFAVLTPDLVLQAEEIFITNSLLEVAPVRTLAERTFAPVPGEITKRLSDLYTETVHHECE